MTDQIAAKKRQGHVLSQEKEIENIISKETDRQVFNEITTLYQDYMDQIAHANLMIRKLIGSYNNPGTIWKLVEFYGTQPNKEDRQEHVLKNKNKVWSIRRTNPQVKWDVNNAYELFKLAYIIDTAEDGSPKQTESFVKFKELLESLMGSDSVVTDQDWWSVIKDASDLFRTSVIRTVDVNALEALRTELSPILVQALCTTLPPVYAIQMTSLKSVQEQKGQENVMCANCHKMVDDDSFFCKFCGDSLGKE